MMECLLCRADLGQIEEGRSATCPNCGALTVVVGAAPDWVAAYRDARFAERACDFCGGLYRGPAVYCSFQCAVDDA